MYTHRWCEFTSSFGAVNDCHVENTCSHALLHLLGCIHKINILLSTVSSSIQYTCVKRCFTILWQADEAIICFVHFVGNIKFCVIGTF